MLDNILWWKKNTTLLNRSRKVFFLVLVSAEESDEAANYSRFKKVKIKKQINFFILPAP